jgi:2-polyprenyl-3-methyl-5-hydroxy-6-metoxy-1,4-benzoquinol methylase
VNKCEICGTAQWTSIYHGRIRDGIFGNWRDHADIYRCDDCGVARLAEKDCPPPDIYETEQYRAKLQRGLTAGDYFTTHDDMQIFTQNQVWPTALRGMTIGDIGCGGGALLDHYAGIAKSITAIEPSDIFHDRLRNKGYGLYRYADDAARSGVALDFAFSIQVIEHVENPREFLASIRRIMKPESRLLISTPNRDDILMKLLPDEFPPFFYRTVHRWYFDAKSLDRCVRAAGFKVLQRKFSHRYPLSNALSWLRDRKPSGWKRLDGITPLGDSLWQQFLVESGQSDCLYLELTPEGVT